MRFYATAAAAQQAGFRACLRCRPDATPGSPEWNIRADVVARAMRLIRDGVVDREGRRGPGRPPRLQHAPAEPPHHRRGRAPGRSPWRGPSAARRRDVLLETTDLPVAHVAFAAGFASVRQCNDTVRQTFADTPSGLRARAARTAQGRRVQAGAGHPGHPAPPALPATLQPGVGARLPRPARPARRRGARRRRPTRAACASPTGTASSRCARRRPTSAPTARPTWRASSSCRTCATCRPRWPAAASCSTSTPTPSPSGRPCATTRSSARWCGVIPDAACPAPPTASSSPCAPSSGSRSRSPVRAPWPGGSSSAAGELLPAPVGAVTHLFPTPAALVELAERDPGAFAMPAGRRRALVALAQAVDAGDVVIDPGRRPGRAAPLAGGAPGHRALDGRVRRHAGAARPRRLHADRPRHPPGAPWRSACPTTRPSCVADRTLATLAQLRHGPPVGMPGGGHTATPHPTYERTCRMTTTTSTHAPPCPWTPRSGSIVLEGDGDVLIGLRLPNDAGLGRRGRGRSPVLKETATQLEEYFAGERTDFDLRMELDGTPFQTRGVGRAGAHPLRRDHQLRRAGPPGRAAQGAARRGPGQRPQPDRHHRALPPRAGEQRHRWLRRRAAGASARCSRWRVSRPRVRRWKRPRVSATRST